MRYIELLTVVCYLLASIVLLPRLVTKRDLKSLEILTIFFILQNLICIFASDTLPTVVAQYVILYKELILYGTVIIYFLLINKGRIKKIILPVIFVAIIMLLYMLKGNASVFTKLVSFRQLLTPFILLLYGYTLKLDEEDFRKYIFFFLNICTCLSIIGLVERFILGDWFWHLVHIEKYMEIKGFSKWVYSNGLPGNFYSADLYSLIGVSFRRLCGAFADPLLTGHFLAIGVVILLFTKVFSTYRQYCTLILLTLTVVLTLSKGAILVICVAYLYKLWRVNKKLLFLLLPIALAALYIIISKNIFDTVARHLGGLTSSLSLEFLLGGGIGSSGNFSNLYGGASTTSGESYIGMVIGQMGIIGVIAFLSVFVYWGKKLLKKNRSIVALSIFAYVIACVIESFMSESSINYIGSGFAFILFGFLCSKSLGAISWRR